MSRRPARGVAVVCLSAAVALAAHARAQKQPASSAEVHCGADSAVDVLHHTVQLTLQLEAGSLAGRGEVTVRPRRASGMLALDAHGLRIERALFRSRPLSFAIQGGQVCVALPRPVAAGARVVLQFQWKVSGGSALHFAPDQVWAGYDAAAWMPTVQDAAQRATLELTLIAPQGMKVVASGRARKRPAPTPSAAGVAHSFVLDRPTQPFLYAFAVGRFEEAGLLVDGIQLRALGPARAQLDIALAITAPMLRYLRQHTSQDPPEREYVQVFVAGDAAQEAAGMALLSADTLDDLQPDTRDDWLFSHELAHQWFGYLVPCADFSDFWLNEGFATFLVAATKEARWGREAYEAELEGWRARSAEVHERGRDAPLSPHAPRVPARPSPADSALPPRGVTYFRGALALHKLRGELGDAAFWAGIQRYVRSRAGQPTRTEQLRAAFESASHRDLEAFFERWIYSPAPDL